MAGRRFYPEALPAPKGAIARAVAYNRAHPNQTFFTPAAQQAADRMRQQNTSPLDRMGNHVENFLQLRALGHQLVQGFDPRSRGGIANIAGLLAGGPKDGMGDHVLGQMGGRFESYSLPKAAAGGNLSSDSAALLTHSHGVPTSAEEVAQLARLKSTQRQEMLQRIQTAHTNPFIRAPREVAAREQQNLLERQSALDIMRKQAADHMALRRQIDDHLGSAPMQNLRPHPGNTNADYLHGPSEIAHPSFLKAMLGRRMNLDGYRPGNN